MSIKTV
jgi:molecular chaperone DnaK (HSP70)